MGPWVQRNMITVARSLIAFLTRGQGISRKEAELRIMEVRKELQNPTVNQYVNLYIHYAQKPESG